MAAGSDPEGPDGGKNVTGRKRHIRVDLRGRLLSGMVLPADRKQRSRATKPDR